MLFWSQKAFEIGFRTEDRLLVDGNDTESTHSKTKFCRSWLSEGTARKGRGKAASNGSARFNKKFEASGDFLNKTFVYSASDENFSTFSIVFAHFRSSRGCFRNFRQEDSLRKSACWSLEHQATRKLGKERRVLGWAWRKKNKFRRICVLNGFIFVGGSTKALSIMIPCRVTPMSVHVINQGFSFQIFVEFPSNTTTLTRKLSYRINSSQLTVLPFPRTSLNFSLRRST